MVWHWNATPSDFGDVIASSMDGTVAAWNTYSNYDYDIGVIYSSGTPTADAGYLGQIRFGGSRNYRVAMHESCHWLGTGTLAAWSGHYRAGRWTGTYAYNLKCAYDGPGERQSGDGQHFWPYGANQDSEGVDAPKMVGIVGAYRRDMDVPQGDRTIGIASGTYRVRNRQTILMADSLSVATEGAQAKQSENSSSLGQQWQVSLITGTTYFTFRNVATGKYLDSLGVTTVSAPVALTSLAGGVPVDSQLWQINAIDSFFFRIVNKATGKALDNLGATTTGSGLVQSSASLSRNQQWTFVHSLVQAAPETGVVSQGRPVTSSSSESGNYDWEGNNGVAGDRWTAATGTYPQWWRVDLGSVQPVTKVAVDWFGGSARTYFYRIETSNDDAVWTTVVNRTSNTQAGSTVDAIAATNARYVRVTVTGATSGFAAFTECRVYNEAVPMRQISQFRPTTASTQQAGNLAVNATDVDAYFTRWSAASASFPQWWQVDLGSVQPVNKAVIEWHNRGAASYQYRIEGSTDGSNYTTLADRTGNVSQDTTTDTFNGSARYVRVFVTGSTSGAAAFYDAQIFSATGPVPPAAPVNVTATAATDRINLAWASVTDATSYTVKRATSPAGPFTVLASPVGTVHSDLGATPGVPYYYVVSSSNSVGTGSESGPVVAAISAGLRTHLAFDETAGASAADSSGFSWPGSLVAGPLWSSGKRGNAVDLDGTDDHVALPVGVLAGLNDFTLAAWVFPDAVTTWARILDFGTGTTSYLFLTPNSGGGTLRFAITNSAGAGEQVLNGPSPLAAGVWTHVAVRLAGNTGTLFVNGAAVATNTAMTLRPSSLGVTTQNWLGRSQYPDPYFNGKIDDFRIYDRALTQTEIDALVAPPLSAVESWRLTHFGVTTDTGSAADAADPDGDGWTNGREFIAGTVPTLAASALRLAVTTPNPADTTLSFPTVSGRSYRLERSETLAVGSWVVVQVNGQPATAIAGTGGVIEITDLGSAVLSRRFYRVVVSNP